MNMTIVISPLELALIAHTEDSEAHEIIILLNLHVNASSLLMNRRPYLTSTLRIGQPFLPAYHLLRAGRDQFFEALKFLVR